MRKSVVLTICVIYILSIVLVGYLGIKLAIFDPILYVQSIELIDDPYSDSYKISHPPRYPDQDFVVKEYSKGLKFRLYCKVMPENATNKEVEFIVNMPDNAVGKLQITSDGEVSVLSDDFDILYAKVYILSKDGQKARSRDFTVQINNFKNPT